MEASHALASSGQACLVFGDGVGIKRHSMTPCPALLCRSCCTSPGTDKGPEPPRACVPHPASRTWLPLLTFHPIWVSPDDLPAPTLWGFHTMAFDRSYILTNDAALMV